MKKLKKKQGFTLIEVVVVMAIIAVLAVLIIGAITVARKTAKETAHRTNAKAIQAGYEAYYSRTRAYPDTTFLADGATFTTAAGATKLNVSLTSSGVCAGGGGIVKNTTSGYTIYVSNGDCSAITVADGTGAMETITGP